MILKQTYEQQTVHQEWQAVYRRSPLLDRLNARILDRVLGHAQLPAGALFLDAGCGDGRHALALARRGYRCVGVDLSSGVLEEAGRAVERAGLADRISLRCAALEDLPFEDGTFDAVHCRGVLMHIPGWQGALAELCRVLRPGGKLVVMEANSSSVEMALVRLLRRFRRTDSELVPTPGGPEFWLERDGSPFVVRVADQAHLAGQLRHFGVRPTARFATEFWDINRFPAGAARGAAARFNSLWFALGLPAWPASGVAVVGEKERGEATRPRSKGRGELPESRQPLTRESRWCSWK